MKILHLFNDKNKSRFNNLCVYTSIKEKTLTKEMTHLSNSFIHEC